VSYRTLVQILVVVILACPLIGCTGKPLPIDPSTRFSREQLQADLQQLKSLIRKYHPGTFTDWSEFEAVFSRQFRALGDSLNIVGFHRLVAPAVSAVRCGHTRLLFQDLVYDHLRENGNFLPFDIRAIGESLFVYQKYTDQTEMPRGSAILAINGQPADEIIFALKDGMWADGTAEGYKYFNINMSLRGRYLSCIADPERFEIVYLAPVSDIPQRTTVTARSTNQVKTYEHKHDLVEPRRPLVETHLAADSGYAALTVRFFDYYDDPTQYRSLLDSFFAQVAGLEIGSLILDLRQNDGGDPYGSAYLLKYLLPRPFRYFTSPSMRFYPDLTQMQKLSPDAFSGELYVLIDGGCFSTTGHLCAMLKAYDAGTFIGTETGGSYVCNGVYNEVTLDQTGLMIIVPRTTFAVDVEGLEPGKGILPDHEVQPTIMDMIENRDPVWGRAVEMIDTAQP